MCMLIQILVTIFLQNNQQSHTSWQLPFNPDITYIYIFKNVKVKLQTILIKIKLISDSSVIGLFTEFDILKFILTYHRQTGP